jgi:hypothetical protein
MKTTDDNALELVELGTISADTQGKGGVYPENFIGMTLPGLTDD